MNSRGKNFTEREKCKLLELVQKHKHIIENMCTNAVSTLKKHGAWELITSEFNSTAEVPRTQKQLSTAYLNLKRCTRKNVATENVKKYLEQQHISELGQNITLDHKSPPQNQMELKQIIKQFKKDEIVDKKGVMATGGGAYKPVLSDVGAQMLALMGDQVKPLTNNCDSASSYYINDENVECDIVVLDDVTPSGSHNYSQPLSITTPELETKTKHKMQPKVKMKTENSDLLKKMCYKKKIECAIIEKKKQNY